jgi:hypothetical protein
MLTRIARISFHNGLVGKHLKTCLKLSMMNSFTNVNKTIYRRMMSNLPTETFGNTGISAGRNYRILCRPIDNSHYRLILKLGKEMQINHHS